VAANVSAPVLPLDLIEEAAQALHIDDPRRNFLEVLSFAWDTNPLDDDHTPWRAAALMLYDVDRLDPLTRETVNLLMQITDQAEDMIGFRGEEAGREDLVLEARELRDATERLHRIVDAVTAVHLLGPHAS
jgi:hypothetical protein